METGTWIILISCIGVGIPILIILYFVIRRLMDLRKLSKPIGTLYIAGDEVYSEFEKPLEEFSDKRQIVLRVKKIKK